MQAPSNLNDRLIACFFLAIEMALQLGINISFTKNINQPLGNSLCCLCALRVRDELNVMCHLWEPASAYLVGGILEFRRKKFSRSYLYLIAASREKFTA